MKLKHAKDAQNADMVLAVKEACRLGALSIEILFQSNKTEQLRFLLERLGKCAVIYRC